MVLKVFIAAYSLLSFPDCQRHLKQPGLRLMQPAAAILKAVASGSVQACYIVSDTVLPLLVEQLSIEDKVWVAMIRCAKVDSHAFLSLCM